VIAWDRLPRRDGCTLDGMLYRSAPPLADFIEDSWVYADYTPPHVKERILPSGTVELVIHRGDNEPRISRHLHELQQRGVHLKRHHLPLGA
jgi:hypothetical protein